MRMKAKTVFWLVTNDPAAAEGALAHNEFGEKHCGWKAGH